MNDSLMLSRSLALALKRQCPVDLYIELSPGKKMNDSLRLSRTLALAPLASNRVHFTNPDEFSLCAVLATIARNTKISRVGDLDCEPQHWLRPADDFERCFGMCPEAIRNTRRVAD